MSLKICKLLVNKNTFRNSKISYNKRGLLLMLPDQFITNTNIDIIRLEPSQRSLVFITELL